MWEVMTFESAAVVSAEMATGVLVMPAVDEMATK